jgi:hypothetical protein
MTNHLCLSTPSDRSNSLPVLRCTCYAQTNQIYSLTISASPSPYVVSALPLALPESRAPEFACQQFWLSIRFLATLSSVTCSAKQDCDGGGLCFASDCLLISAAARHLLRPVQTHGKSEFACSHRLRDQCTSTAKFEGCGLCDALIHIHMPTPS